MRDPRTLRAGIPSKHVDALARGSVNEKCCEKCAFREGSPERNDPWTWIRISENATEGVTFYCHESIPGHPQEVVDSRPRYRVCSGRAANDGKDIMHFCFPAIKALREEQDSNL